MRHRTIATLAVALTALFASTASASVPGVLAQCAWPDNPAGCHWLASQWPQAAGPVVGAGENFSTFIDYKHIFPGPLSGVGMCDLYFSLIFDVTETQFVGAKRWLPDHVGNVSCEVESISGVSFCPGCDSVLNCTINDPFRSIPGEPRIDDAYSEVELTWKATTTTDGSAVIYYDYWQATDWAVDGTCSVPIASGYPAPDLVMYVPEPSAAMMICAGVPALLGLARRRARR